MEIEPGCRKCSTRFEYQKVNEISSGVSHDLSKRIIHTLGSLYESAREGSAEAWLDSYRQMAGLFSSGPGSLAFYSPDEDRYNFITTTYSDDGLRAYNAHFRHINPFHKQIAQMRVGETFWRVRDRPDRDFITTEFYQDFLRKEDIYDVRIFKLCRHSGKDVAIGFSRPKNMPPFDRDVLDGMEFLLPHLQRACQIYAALSDIRSQKGQMEEIINKSPRGIILLNGSAKVIYCNEAAETIILAKDGLEMDRNRCLLARNARETKQLKLVLNSVFDTKTSASHGGFLHISRPSGQRPFQVHISPLSQHNFGGYSPEKLALLFVFDPEQRFGTVEELLRRMYGLTPAEARLAGMLTKGMSQKEAAELLNVKQSTIHTHMKHIFSKTDCKRQGELITIIFNGLAGLKNL